jgi:hypothetical protein
MNLKIKPTKTAQHYLYWWQRWSDNWAHRIVQARFNTIACVA